jgi:hypothetical protein
VRCVAAGAVEQRFRAGHQLVVAERLEDVVVGPASGPCFTSPVNADAVTMRIADVAVRGSAREV